MASVVAVAKYDWEKIRDEYVCASDSLFRPTLDELAAKYRCSPSYLREVAAEQGWTQQASDFSNDVESKRREQRSSELAGELAQFDSACYRVARGGLQKIFEKLQAAIALGEPICARDLESLSKALEKFQKVGKTALGEDATFNLKVDYSGLSDEQLQRLAEGEDPHRVIFG